MNSAQIFPCLVIEQVNSSEKCFRMCLICFLVSKCILSHECHNGQVERNLSFPSWWLNEQTIIHFIQFFHKWKPQIVWFGIGTWLSINLIKYLRTQLFSPQRVFWRVFIGLAIFVYKNIKNNIVPGLSKNISSNMNLKELFFIN